MRRKNDMGKLSDHVMILRDSNRRDERIDEAVGLAAGSTSLPIGSGIRDLVSQMGDNRERIIQIITSGQTACLTIVLITNNFGEIFDDLTRIDAHQEMLKEQLEITQSVEQKGWEFGLFSKYIQLSRIQRLEDGQERHLFAPENLCLPNYHIKFQGTKVDQSEILPIIDFLETFNQKSSLTYRFACLGVAISTSSLGNEQTEEEIRTEINHFLIFLHYILSIHAKLSPQLETAKSLAAANLCDDLESLRSQFGQNEDQAIIDRIAEAVYSVTLTVAPEKLLYSRLFIQKILAFSIDRRGSGLENKLHDDILDRLRFDHKFSSLNNTWCFSEWIESDLSKFAGKYYVYSDIHNLALGSGFHSIRSFGIKTPLIALTNSFLKNEIDASTFIQKAFIFRLRGEVLINEYYAELGKYWLDEDQCVPCFYVEVGDQVQGVISDFHTAIRAFERARHAVAYRLKSGLGIVKIDEQTNLADLRRKAEFGLDVTKLFKDFHREWEKYQLVGEPFSYGKTVAVLNLFRENMKNPDANSKFLRRTYRNKDQWIQHCHPKFQGEMERTFSEIYSRNPGERMWTR